MTRDAALDALWIAAPGPAIRVWREGGQPRFRLNDAATRWALGAALAEADWAALAARLLDDAPGAAVGLAVVGVAEGVSWTAVALAPGWLCWLVPQPSIADQPADTGRSLIASTTRDPSVGVDFEEALELASISVWRVDLARRRIYYNAAGYRLSGLPFQHDGLSLDEVRALAHPDDLRALRAASDEAVATHGVVDVEARYRNPDGSYRHLLTRRVAQRNERGEVVGLMGISIDQTAQIAERERAQALRRRIETVAEAAGVGVWSFDVESGRLEWNAQMYRIHGLPEGEVVRLRDWSERVLHPQDRATVLGLGRRMLRSQGTPGTPGVDAEYRIVRPDGAVRWVESRGLREVRDGRELLLGIVLDVTERHAFRAQLQTQQERLALATRAAGMGVWERDLAGGMRYWDEQMYRLRGLEPTDPRPLDELALSAADGSDLGEFVRQAQRHLETGEPYLRELRIRWPDGALHWLMSAGTALRDEQGQPVGITGVNWDVTQRREAEQALRDKELAENASRAKSEFLARMSHELRTPLNAVLGFAQLIELDTAHALPEVQRARVERIRSAGGHLLALIEDVLDLASIEAGRLPVAIEPVDLDEALDDVVEWVGTLAKARSVQLQVPPTRACVAADARRLRQVLVNLLSNAVKYNQPGGRVWVECRDASRDGVDGYSIGVRDNGRGITTEHLAHLFEPFNRLGAERESIEGVGIGLVVVRHLVELMGGTIQVESTRGQGSEFRVWLAAAAGKQRRAPPVPTLPGELDGPEAPTSAPLAMLYIEDNPVNVILVQELIEMRGHARLRIAVDGLSGVAVASAEPFDLVLVDMQLPDIDGFEVLRRLLAQPRTRRRVVIGLSANATPEDLRAALVAGFDDYWTKPIDFKRFLTGLDRIAAARAVEGN